MEAGEPAVNRGAGRTIYYENNTGLAVRFATAGATVYNKLKETAGGRRIRIDWPGNNLSRYDDAGFRPSP